MNYLLLLLLAASTASAQWTTADPSAVPGSGMPNLTKSPSGEVYLSWIDPSGDNGHALRFAKWNGTSWSSPETISEGKNWFINWADFPSLFVSSDGSMLAHWLVRAEGGSKYGYGIRVARRDLGTRGRWRQMAAFNENDSDDYAGFLSFTGNTAAYLSPLKTGMKNSAPHEHGSEEGHLKTLRFATFGREGSLASDVEIDGDVCSCCQTSSAAIPSGTLIAYRDHLPGEIRDISIIRVKDGRAGSPEVLHRDGWQINGCPTEGPSVAALGNNVGIAWMTRAAGVSRLQLSLSQDGGQHFRAPVAADNSNPLGRPHLVPLSANELLLTWLERDQDAAAIRIRRVSVDGTLGPSVVVARVAASRTTGLPRVAIHGEQVLVAWREGGVRAGWLPLAAVPRIAPKTFPQIK